MTKEQITKTKLFKFFLPIFIVACIIKIFSAGYASGQWLYQLLPLSAVYLLIVYPCNC